MTKTLRSVAANPSPGRWGRCWLLALGGWVVAAVLSGCAGGAGSPSASVASSEPVTESDEPEARKRARIRLELASSYFENGQTTVALDEIKQSLVADPGFGAAFVLRGLVYMRLNDPALAEDSFRRALQINARDADALHNYGWLVCNQKRYRDAIQMFDSALSNPTYGGRAKTLMLKATCQLRMGDAAGAERTFALAYELDPANPYVGYNLANLEYQRGEYTRAQFVIRRINNSELANAETLWLGIKVERRLNHTEATEQLAQQLSRRYPKSREWTSYQRGAFDE